MSRINVLIADDVSSMRALLKTHLHKYNCDVCREVDDGRKVIDAVKQSEPDIVLLDINMPGKNGLEVLKELVEKNIHNKVWIISGEAAKSVVVEAKLNGAIDFIAKPFTIDKIAKIVKQYEKLSALEERTNVPSNSKPTSVFIVDDEPLMQALLVKVISNYHCQVMSKFSSGKEVINAFKSGRIPEITFLDIEMPECDGLEVLKFIKDNKVDTFVVMVSAHGTLENVKMCMESGADGFIVKPYSDKKVQQIVNKYRNA